MLIRFTFCCISLLILAGCGVTEINHPYPQINKIPRGSAFCIILPENHRDGYTWQLQKGYNPSVIGHINEVWHGNEKGIYFNFKALSAGQTTLSLLRRKYTDTADIKQFVVKISDN